MQSEGRKCNVFGTLCHL